MITYIIFTLVVLLLIITLYLFVRKNSAMRTQIENLGEQTNEYRLECAVLSERLAASAEKQREIEEQKGHLLELFNKERAMISDQFTQKFNLLANDILETKSRTMSTQSSDTIKAMLLPFGEKIDKFRERIEQESKHRFALENEVKRLSELNMQMSRQANSLVSALKGNSKSQGDWGEMILETLLENSGLRRDIHFRVQQTIRGAGGEILRPDVILCLPDEKEVVIDSKVSLTAYVSYCEAQQDQDDTRAKLAMSAHILSVRNHIGELGRKSYQKAIASPDFVIMFIPNEPAFLLALQGDNALWQEAYKKGVVLSSPTNLFAILRIVDDLWKRDSQDKNALEIARQGGDLYDKFVGFAETFSDVGRAIKRSDELYEKSLGQLTTGSGNLVRRAETLRKLGIKTSKKLPSTLVEQE